MLINLMSLSSPQLCLVQMNSLPAERIQEIQKAIELFSVGQGPAKTMEEASKRSYQFWDTQPVPKLGMYVPSSRGENPGAPELCQGFYSGFVGGQESPVVLWWPFLKGSLHNVVQKRLLFRDFIISQQPIWRINNGPFSPSSSSINLQRKTVPWHMMSGDVCPCMYCFTQIL